MFGEVKREGGATKVRWEGGAMLLFIPKVKKSGTPFSQSLPADSTKIWSEKHGSFLSFDDEQERNLRFLYCPANLKNCGGEDILNLQQELNELNASLKEEKWYSAALKEEVDKITKDKVELEEKNSLLEKVSQVTFF